MADDRTQILHKSQLLKPNLGMPPGTLIADPTHSKPVIQVFGYDATAFVEEHVRSANAVARLKEQWPVVWVNVDGLGDAQAIQELGSVFGLHKLALEDVLDTAHRPKAELYDSHTFMVTRMVEGTLPLRTEQLCIFFGDGFVVTLQERPGDCLDPVRMRIREKRGVVREMGADYLAYTLLDAVIDAYFPHLDALSDYVEAIEEEVVTRPTPQTVSKIHAAKRNLMEMRRILSPQREAINTLILESRTALTETTRLHLRDCHDHTMQLLDLVDTHREVVSGLLDIYLTSVSNRMNEVMKILTIIATLFIPLTFVAGVYGMNFDPDASLWNMPELRMRWGYPAAMLGMALVAGIELFIFWRKGWLGGSNASARKDGGEQDRKK